MSAAPLNPISSAQMDADLGQQADVVTALAVQIAAVADFYLTVLVEANRAAGLLIDLPQYAGSPPTPMTAEDMARYVGHFETMRYVGSLLSADQGSNPAAVRMVLPWTRQGQQVNQAMYGR